MRKCNLNTLILNCNKRVRTPVAQLRSLLGKYPWERYEPAYPPSYGLNSTTTVLLGEAKAFIHIYRFGLVLLHIN